MADEPTETGKPTDFDEEKDVTYDLVAETMKERYYLLNELIALERSGDPATSAKAVELNALLKIFTEAAIEALHSLKRRGVKPTDDQLSKIGYASGRVTALLDGWRADLAKRIKTEDLSKN